MQLLALNVAILPPAEVRARAIDLSAALPRPESHGLRLGDDYIPHITLVQQFIRADERELAFEKVEAVLREQSPLALKVTGGGKGANAVWIAIERSPELRALHERLMEALKGVERGNGTVAAFAGGDARVGDVMWVSSYRQKASFDNYTPHITLGHAEQPPEVTPRIFNAATIAACHLGRYCSCRTIFRSWSLR